METEQKDGKWTKYIDNEQYRYIRNKIDRK